MDEDLLEQKPASSEDEGEDLIEDMEKDYQANPALDRYDHDDFDEESQNELS